MITCHHGCNDKAHEFAQVCGVMWCDVTISNDIVEISFHNDYDVDHAGRDFAQICAACIRHYEAPMKLRWG